MRGRSLHVVSLFESITITQKERKTNKECEQRETRYDVKECVKAYEDMTVTNYMDFQRKSNH